MQNHLPILQEWLAQAQAMVVLTGAGMGVDSGMKTFRGEDGSWGKLEADSDKTIFELSNPQMFIDNPKWIWSLFARRMKEYAQTTPHAGFQILKKWIEKLNLDYFILTSNVDSHFQKAGFPETHIRELHGSLNYLQSVQPQVFSEIWRNDLDLNTLEQSIEADIFPLSPDGKTMARPNVYMFRDYFYLETRSKAQDTHYQAFLQRNEGKKIIAFEIGSGPHVQTIRLKTRQLITHYGAKVARINPQNFKIKEPHLGLAQGALQALNEIDNYLEANLWN
jgi:NAD-dependent SIR2 family protein deacetylase